MSATIATQQARQAAQEILERFPFRSGLSVDVKKIAFELNIKIIEGELEKDGDKSISGLLKINGQGGQPVIAIKATESEQRKRFTIAHELGHYILHKDEMVHVDPNTERVAFRDGISSLAVDTKEIQANQFAAELLMPSNEVRDIVNSTLDNDEEITAAISVISRRYRVSPTAATIKISSLLNAS